MFTAGSACRVAAPASKGNWSCARAKGEPEEGGFPGRAFEEDPRLSIRSVVRLSNRRVGGPLPGTFFALYQREALLWDFSGSLRQDWHFLLGRTVRL